MSALPKFQAIPKKVLSLVLAVVLAILGVFMVASYLKQKETALVEYVTKKIEQEKASKAVNVVIARRNISKDETIEPDMVKEEIAPQAAAVPGVIMSADRVVGRIAAVDITKGEQIIGSYLALKEMKTLATMTPPGKRAVTVYADPTSTMGGKIKPGDYVDVITIVPVPTEVGGKQEVKLLTLPLFNNVLVLDVGGQGDKKEMPSMVTLALIPKEAAMLSFVQDQQGKIRLVLRSPQDTQIEQIPPVSWDTIFYHVAPPPKQREVEIFRGTQKEVISIPDTSSEAKNEESNE